MHDATLIGRLRVRADCDDALALQMRSEAAVRTLDVRPAAMPSQAILCIRSLTDPLPGGIDTRFSHAARATAWEHAARGSVDGAFHRAIRPALTMVPANADAVLFADRAELLACAARDACRGLLHEWWWKWLLRTASTEEVVREWKRQPAFVPAAVELIAASGDAVAFVRKLTATDATELIARIAEVFWSVEVRRRYYEPIPSVEKRRPHATTRIPPPPWHVIAPEAERSAALTIEQRAFLGMALALRRAPAIARSETFVVAARKWMAEAASPPAVDSREVEFVSSPPGITAALVSPEAASERPVTIVKPRHRKRHPSSKPLSPVPPSETVEPIARPRHRSAAGSAAGAPATRQRRERVAARPKRRHADIAQVEERVAMSQPDVQPATPPPLNESHPSSCAGLFFLLNALRGEEPPPKIDYWIFLHAVARALLEDIDDDDPVWSLLESLAAMKRTPSRWRLSRVVKRVRKRLAILAIEGDAATFLIRRYGRIRITPAYVDVFFSLQAHPIEIRIAGLDRNPGWIPAAGRYVVFHFD